MDSVITAIAEAFTLDNLGNLDLIWWIIIITAVVVFFLTNINRLAKVLIAIFLTLVVLKYYGIIASSIFTW